MPKDNSKDKGEEEREERRKQAETQRKIRICKRVAWRLGLRSEKDGDVAFAKAGTLAPYLYSMLIDKDPNSRVHASHIDMPRDNELVPVKRDTMDELVQAVLNLAAKDFSQTT